MRASHAARGEQLALHGQLPLSRMGGRAPGFAEYCEPVVMGCRPAVAVSACRGAALIVMAAA
eukprot:5909479-Alexandrium_andersonii.AAC.1